jgi:hypothetical protein
LDGNLKIFENSELEILENFTGNWVEWVLEIFLEITRDVSVTF